MERDALRRLPVVWPDLSEQLEVRASSDAFVRVGGVDYSVPPRLAGRRLSVNVTLDEVAVHCEGERVARHIRSWVKADVVLAAAHARELRLAREARRRLAADEVVVEMPALTAYDELVS